MRFALLETTNSLIQYRTIMKKKFICPICGYVHEGEEAPERCPQCKQIVEWKVVDESAALNFITEHVLGIAKGTGEDMIKDLNAISWLKPPRLACIWP